MIDIDELAPPRLRVLVELHEPHRQAVRVGIVLASRGFALGAQLRGPRLQRQRIAAPGHLAKRRQRDAIGRRRHRFSAVALTMGDHGG